MSTLSQFYGNANLDVAVSSRAPASTALSNATWTNARAAKLDLVETANKIPNVVQLGDTLLVGKPTSTNWQQLFTTTSPIEISGLRFIALVDPGATNSTFGVNVRLLVGGVQVGLHLCRVNTTAVTTYLIGLGTTNSFYTVGRNSFTALDPIMFPTGVTIQAQKSHSTLSNNHELTMIHRIFNP